DLYSAAGARQPHRRRRVDTRAAPRLLTARDLTRCTTSGEVLPCRVSHTCFIDCGSTTRGRAPTTPYGFPRRTPRVSGPPVCPLTAWLPLAIGLGANPAVFPVANAVLFRPPSAVASPERLVDIGTSKDGNGFGPSSFPNYIDLRDRTTTLEHVYAQNLLPKAMSLGVSGNSSGERVFGSYVTLNYFAGVGVIPAAGRLFDAGDDSQPGAAPIAVLSHGFWARRFNRDPAIVGSRVLLDGRPFTIVGVTAEGFHGTTIRSGDLWVPPSM